MVECLEQKAPVEVACSEGNGIEVIVSWIRDVSDGDEALQLHIGEPQPLCAVQTQLTSIGLWGQMEMGY